MPTIKHSAAVLLVVFCGCHQSDAPSALPQKPSGPSQKASALPQKIPVGMDYAQAKAILVGAGFPEWENPARDMVYPTHVLLCEYAIDRHTALEVFTDKNTGRIVEMARMENADQAKGERKWIELSEITVSKGQIQTTALKPATKQTPPSTQASTGDQKPHKKARNSRRTSVSH